VEELYRRLLNFWVFKAKFNVTNNIKAISDLCHTIVYSHKFAYKNPSKPTLMKPSLQRSTTRLWLNSAFFLLITISSSNILLAQISTKKKIFTFEDAMQFKAHSDVAISDDGQFLGFNFWPDLGDGEAQIYKTATAGSGDYSPFLTIPYGKNITFNRSASFAAITLKVPTEWKEDKETKKKSKSFDSLAVYSLNTAERLMAFDSLKTFAFSPDGNVLAVLREAQEFKDAKKSYGSSLHLLNLSTSEEAHIDWVTSMSMDSSGTHLIISIADTSGQLNALQYIALKNNFAINTIASGVDHEYDGLTWQHNSQKVVFSEAKSLGKKKGHEQATVHIFDAKAKAKNVLTSLDKAKLPTDVKEAYKTPFDQSFYWSADGDRLFFGLQEDWIFNAVNKAEVEENEEDTSELYDVNRILAKKTVDVWHTEDPMIKTHEKKQWNNTKNARLSVVYHLKNKTLVALGSKDLALSVRPSDHSNRVLASYDNPYAKERTWDGFYADQYVVDVQTGEASKIATRHSGDLELSPDGNRVVFFQDSTWHTVQFTKKMTITKHIQHNDMIHFANEDHDSPSQVPSYGFGAWVGDNQAIVYDKFDLLLLNLDNSQVENSSAGNGRETKNTYRILNEKRNPKQFKTIQNVVLSAYNQQDKSYGLYELKRAGSVPTKIIHDAKKWDVAAKAKEASRWIFTKEDYHEYPDFYVVDEANLASPKRLTNLHPEIDDYAWGRSELIEYTSLDGTPMQGVVIKPGNYEEGKQYPVLIYYYRFFTQRLHEFNIPRVNHRPSFPIWASDDYLIFLPDIRFEVGRPGLAATKSLVPGVQEIIKRGYADPDNIGLHGHSWSGYQTAFMITQTDIFKAAIAGAPVSNMTSAYGGIRWGSGLARAFQYEKTQSRLGVSMWDNLQPYIENSPLFYADKINTPLLFIHGDADGAVPWYQSIELYVAMRRLGKEAVFLQYHGEDHHPAAYPNKLDWAVKMKEYFDHYLKGKPAAWVTEGVRYEGE